MNPEQEEFQQLRRLLVLKRYEQPPPGFFEDFSQQVIIRIQAGERIDNFSLWEALSWEAPWLQRFWAALETRPILAGGFGIGICGLLLAGMLYSETHDATPLPEAVPLAQTEGYLRQSNSIIAAVPANSLLDRAANAPLPSMQGIAPVQPSDSLFQQLKDNQQSHVLPASASSLR